MPVAILPRIGKTAGHSSLIGHEAVRATAANRRETGTIATSVVGTIAAAADTVTGIVAATVETVGVTDTTAVTDPGTTVATGTDAATTAATEVGTTAETAAEVVGTALTEIVETVVTAETVGIAVTAATIVTAATAVTGAMTATGETAGTAVMTATVAATAGMTDATTPERQTPKADAMAGMIAVIGIRTTARGRATSKISFVCFATCLLALAQRPRSRIRKTSNRRDCRASRRRCGE